MATSEGKLNGGEGDDIVNRNDDGDDLVQGNDGSDFGHAGLDRIFGGAELSGGGQNWCRSVRRCRRRRWPCRRCRPLASPRSLRPRPAGWR